MATIVEFDYIQGKNNIADYDPNGRTVMQVWTTVIGFGGSGEFVNYFNDPNHKEHILCVETDVVNGQPKFVYMFDRKDVSSVYPPEDTLPTETELFARLDNLVSLYG